MSRSDSKRIESDVALYFLSDVHLRLDRPERGRRLARLVDRLGDGDRIVVVGDLADFWFASRQQPNGIAACEGLRALAGFRRRGGGLALLPGNHDAWLEPLYRDFLGLGYLGGSVDLVEDGLRIHVTHGHTVGARSPWKAWMESRAFLRAFRAAPGPLARRLDGLLETANEVERETIDRKHLARYRRHADSLRDKADLVIFGHVHRTHDDDAAPRMVVLGGWHHRSSYFRMDAGRAELIVEEDP